MIATCKGGPWGRGGGGGTRSSVQADAHAGLLVQAAGHADRHALGDQAAACEQRRARVGPRRPWSVASGPRGHPGGMPRRRSPDSGAAPDRSASRRAHQREVERLPQVLIREREAADRPESALDGHIETRRPVGIGGAWPASIRSSHRPTVMANRSPHLGHFRRLPAAALAGKFRMMPQF